MAKVSQPNVVTYSRFAALEEDSEDEKIEKENEEKKSNAAKNAKKRAKRKKKAVAQTNELRNLAFSKPVSAKVIQNIHQQRHAQPGHEGDSQGKPVENGKLDSQPVNIPIEDCNGDWEQWRSKDEQFVVDQFQKDLEKALRMSAEIQQPVQQVKSKKKAKTMSLDEFVATEQENNTHDQPPPPVEEFYVPNGYSPEELDPNHYDTCINPDSYIIPENNTTAEPTQNKKKKKKKKTSDNKALSEVLEELHTEEKEPESPPLSMLIGSTDAASLASWQNEIEEKDKEIVKLKRLNEKLKDELGQVKKRNKQFCFILAQGEMKDKSEILLQVDELTNIKNELSEQLAEMHMALEQERSKNSGLKLELTKQQNHRNKGKVAEEK